MTAEKSVEPKTPKNIEYISKESEPIRFEVQYVGGGWPCRQKLNDGRLIWIVPSSEAENFEKHHFFQTGRIIKKK